MGNQPPFFIAAPLRRTLHQQRSIQQIVCGGGCFAALFVKENSRAIIVY
jgi:hypothetical protein